MHWGCWLWPTRSLFPGLPRSALPSGAVSKTRLPAPAYFGRPMNERSLHARGCLELIRSRRGRRRRLRQSVSKAMAASGGVTTYNSSTTTTSKSWLSSSSASVSVSSKAKSPGDEGRKFVHKPSSLPIPSIFSQKVDRTFGQVDVYASFVHVQGGPSGCALLFVDMKQELRELCFI